ncbi:hypothetical protein LEP3755_05200 [Leptolyngbya sp. NIES-3755]|nr:hypothetical protein LEP3755_05200 [Leptolyngbya sp. NIES-3755]
MKPDFSAMSRKELRAYLLDHREDEEAFFAYVDRSEVEANWIELPPVESIEDLQNFPEFLKKLDPTLEQ